MNYQLFDNSTLSLEANSVRFFLQDSLGMIWIGSNKGLYSYDGYTSNPHYEIGTPANSLVNCGLFYGNDYLLLGSESGLLLYNYKKDVYTSFEVKFNHDVRALLIVGDELWIGSFDGLFKYNFTTGKLSELMMDMEEGRKHGIVYTLLEYKGYIYIGSYNSFGRYRISSNQFEPIGNQYSIGGTYSLLKDDTRKCIWIGKGTHICKYDPSTGNSENIIDLPVGKTMVLDCDNNLVIGTDNGLYIYNEENTWFYTHDSREAKSLANNVVWSVYKDHSDNIWLGTDNGISFSPRYRRFEFIPIYQFTGVGESNQFYSVFRDSKGFYWLGGTNGLIRTNDLMKHQETIRWYNMDSQKYHLFHNRVRDIYEDDENNLWLASDYGINRYNYNSEQFEYDLLRSSESSHFGNWVYDVLADNKGRLWLACFNGGVFVIGKNELLSSRGMHESELNFATFNGLSGDNVDIIVSDYYENIWALSRNAGIDIIHSVDNSITRFEIDNYTNGENPTYMLSDSEGFIWVGFRNGVLKVNPSNSEIECVKFTEAANAEVITMAQVDTSIWLSTTEGIWIVNNSTLKTQHVNIVNNVFTSIFYDKEIDKVLLGSVDGIALSSPSVAEEKIENNRILITAIKVNNKTFFNTKDSLSVRYIDEVELSYNQNNIILEISDLEYSKDRRGTYIFKFDNQNDEWTTLKADDNTIYLSKLKPGEYNLLITRMGNDRVPSQPVRSFKILINPPWYGTTLAKVIYLLFILGLIFWVFNFFAQKNRLKIERIEKEKSIEQSKMKIAFFSDIAHEFKTPLSLIIAPLSGLIHDAKNTNEKNALEMISQNAMKLNSLIHQAIDFYRDDSKVNIGLMHSKVELVEFAQSIFSTYKESMKDKQLEFVFNTNSDKIYVNIDAVKIESVLNNLLSNACKFTNPGDSIILSLEYQHEEGMLEIKVSDTGIGIPSQDLPYVFQRFYQSHGNSNEKDGTGIGLYLVKNYVDLHGGSVKVISTHKEGTTFTVTLPALSENSSKVVQKTVSESPANRDQELIAIIEDNVAIADFIHNIFASEYRCVIANNGKTGLKMCTELLPDMIISDIMMPVMDGIEMTRRLKKNVQTSTIPLIFLTAKDDKDTELKSINLNIDAFIAKPFDSSILYSRVKQLLESKKQMAKKARIEKIATPAVEKVESADEKFLAQITKIIEKNIADPDLNVNHLSEMVHVSPKQLYRKVKQLTGMTTVEYIKSIRMKKAAVLLSNKNFTVAEVMYMVGFSSHSYFAKCFQAKFGKTPRQFVE